MRDIGTNEFNSFTQIGGATSGSQSSPRSYGFAAETPALYVTRYCNLLPASLAAAVRDGVRVLDAHAAQHGNAPSAAPVIGVRNKRQETVTLDIYLPVEAVSKSPRTGEVRAGSAPGAEALMSGGAGSLADFLLVVDELADTSAWRLDLDAPGLAHPKNLDLASRPRAHPVAKDVSNARN